MSAPARYPRGRLAARPDSHYVQPAVRWGFYAFVFSIPLEYPDRTIPLEVHTITGSLFLLIALVQPQFCFRRPPAAFWWLAAYLWIYLILGLVAEHTGEALKLFGNYLLVAFLFWVSYNLMRHESVARAAVLSFVLACALLALLHFLGIGTRTIMDGQVARRTIFGQNANLLGSNMALGFAAVIALTYGVHKAAFQLPLAAGLALLLGNSLILSGSRGAMVALGVGLLAFTLQIGNISIIARNLALALLAGAAVTWAAYTSDSMRTRYEQTLSKGRLSGREQIYPAAWQMFVERPLTGWGPVDNNYELGWRTVGYRIGSRWALGLSPKPDKDFHNLMLDVLTATGVLGAFPLLMCIALCVRAAWKARAGPQGTMPFALAAVVLVVSMSIDVSASKQPWLIFALAAASGSRVSFRARGTHVPARVTSVHGVAFPSTRDMGAEPPGLSVHLPAALHLLSAPPGRRGFRLE